MHPRVVYHVMTLSLTEGVIEILKLLRRLADDERVRYLFVGGWNTLFGYLLFLALLAAIGKPIASLASSDFGALAWAGTQYYLVVSWIGWIFAVAQSTLTMKYLVFRKGGSYWKQTFRAYFVYIPSQLIGSAILWFLVRIIGLIPQVAALLNIAITVVFSYLGHKYFTFRLPNQAEAATPIIEGDDGAEAPAEAKPAGSVE